MILFDWLIQSIYLEEHTNSNGQVKYLRLNLDLLCNLSGNFYESELLSVNKPVDSLWLIEKTIKKRIRNGRVEWLVKFEGWPKSFNEWVKETDIKDVSR